MSGPSIPKDKPIRSAKLREAAREAPECFSCHRPNDGTVVGCHPPNKLGKAGGMGHKGNDVLGYACMECHDLMDGRRGTLTRFERENRWLDCFYWSTVWLIQSGRLG